MLFYSHVPLKFQVDACNTATFTINWLPALTIYNMSSFEILYVKPPSYSNFHLFECLVYPYLWDYAPHKLNLCSCSCVLFGYNMSHHGFHYLYRLTNQVFTFRHDIFYEHKYSFPELAYSRSLFSFFVNAFLEPIPTITRLWGPFLTATQFFITTMSLLFN
jgi:hypothetical protein